MRTVAPRAAVPPALLAKWDAQAEKELRLQRQLSKAASFVDFTELDNDERPVVSGRLGTNTRAVAKVAPV